jgi:hypothetical protein
VGRRHLNEGGGTPDGPVRGRASPCFNRRRALSSGEDADASSRASVLPLSAGVLLAEDTGTSSYEKIRVLVATQTSADDHPMSRSRVDRRIARTC